jgi:hypothetical protein
MSGATPEVDPANACKSCGVDNPVWYAPNDVWNSVMGSEAGFLCPACFIVRAESTGLVPTAWVLRPETDADLAAVGICGDRSPSTPFGGREFCVLRHGHADWHEAATLLRQPYGIAEPLRWSPGLA